MSSRESVYGTSPLKRRRRTKAELAALDEAILQVCTEEGRLTVRGVFYKVMSLGVVPKTEKGYDAVQRRVLVLRRAGDLPYSRIADGTRWHIKPRSWTGLDEMLEDAASSYRRALWHDADVYLEVWTEKDAITSIVSEVTGRWDVPLMVARGFTSESFLFTTAEAIRATDKPTVIYQLGDHDPSGVKAWEHIQRRLHEFAPNADIAFERLAVTPAQIIEMDLPTRPTKRDHNTHAPGFEGESVEVDAIPSRALQRIVSHAIQQWIDPHRLAITQRIEREEREDLMRWAGEMR